MGTSSHNNIEHCKDTTCSDGQQKLPNVLTSKKVGIKNIPTYIIESAITGNHETLQ